MVAHLADDRLADRCRRGDDVAGRGLGCGPPANVELPAVAVDELLDRLAVDVGDHDRLDVADLRDCLELCVRLDARADQPEGGSVRAGEVVGGDRRGRARPQACQSRPVHQCERKGRLGVRVDDRPHHRREVVAVGVAHVGIDPLDTRTLPVLARALRGVDVGGHRPEVAVVLWQVDV